MSLTKNTFIFLFMLFFLIGGSSLHAALKYKQKMSFSSWESQETVEKLAQEFCDETVGDPNIEVIGVKYKQKRQGRNAVIYNAIITCRVSEKDRDLIRINGKIFQRKYLPPIESAAE